MIYVYAILFFILIFSAFAYFRTPAKRYDESYQVKLHMRMQTQQNFTVPPPISPIAEDIHTSLSLMNHRIASQDSNADIDYLFKSHAPINVFGNIPFIIEFYVENDDRSGSQKIELTITSHEESVAYEMSKFHNANRFRIKIFLHLDSHRAERFLETLMQFRISMQVQKKEGAEPQRYHQTYVLPIKLYPVW